MEQSHPLPVPYAHTPTDKGCWYPRGSGQTQGDPGQGWAGGEERPRETPWLGGVRSQGLGESPLSLSPGPSRADSDRRKGGQVGKCLWDVYNTVITLEETTITAKLIWHLLYTRPCAKGETSEEGLDHLPRDTQPPGRDLHADARPPWVSAR